ncbi:MAG: hypothetical protein WAK17_17350 [Candidatus Nitrosopolaris sp.]|jgi:hypothetical protein
MIVKIFHENLIQSTTNNLKEDLQKLEDKINVFAGQKGVIIHDIKYEKIQNGQMQQMIIAFVHHTAVNEDTGEVKQDDIPKVIVEKK